MNVLYILILFCFVGPLYAAEPKDVSCVSLKGTFIRVLAPLFPNRSEGVTMPAPMKLMDYIPINNDYGAFQAKVFEGNFFSDSVVGDLIVSFPKGNTHVCLYDIPNPNYDPTQAGTMSRKSLGILEVHKEGMNHQERLQNIEHMYDVSGDFSFIPDINNYESYLDPSRGIINDSSDYERLNQYFTIYHAFEPNDKNLISARLIVLDEIAKMAKILNLENLYHDSAGKIKGLLRLAEAIHASTDLNSSDLLSLDLSENNTKATLKEQEAAYYRFILKNVYGYSSKGIGLTEEGYPLVHNNNWNCDGSVYWNALTGVLPDYPRDFLLGSSSEFFMQIEKIFSDFPTIIRNVKNPAGEGFKSPQRKPKIRQGQLIETADLPNKEHPITEDNLMYVIDEHQNLYIGNTINHPDFTRGRPVICAGHMSIKDGKIIQIDTSSGHYMPRMQHLNAAIKILKDRNVLCSRATLRMHVNNKTIHHIIENKRFGILNSSENIQSIKSSTTNEFSEEQVDESYLPIIQSDVEITLEPPYAILSLENFGQYIHYAGEVWQNTLLEEQTSNFNSILARLVKLSQSHDDLKEMIFGH